MTFFMVADYVAVCTICHKRSLVGYLQSGYGQKFMKSITEVALSI